MKRMESISIGPWAPMMGLWLVMHVISMPNSCFAENVSLILRQTPSVAGQIAPKPGMYDFQVGTEVTLIASPDRNYKFVRWLGDVADPMSSTTVAYLDQNKVIIALFEMTTLNVEDSELRHTSVSAGGSSGGFSSHRVLAAGSGTSASYSLPEVAPSQIVVIPEPNTILLLCTGAVLLRNRYRCRLLCI